MDDMSAWIGKSQTDQETLSPAPLARLAALLDMEPDHWQSGEAPPLAHWLYFLPAARQSEIDSDGHPRRGGFLPPISLPRRMWAGSRIEFVAPLIVGSQMERRTTILSVASKHGASGPLTFVTLLHEVSSNGCMAVREEQDLVYRAAASPSQSAPANAKAAIALPEAKSVRRVTADPAFLFRFSALTFNAHRIHYDRDYACNVEGYAGLVVHAPLQATLLMHHHSIFAPDERPVRFEFRAQRPLIDTEPFDLCLDPHEGGAMVSTRTIDGQAGMTGEIWTA